MNEILVCRNRESGDFKYLALYWALGFEPNEAGVFVKDYGDCRIEIYPENGYAVFGKPLTIVGKETLSLNTRESFVVLECVDRLLELGYHACEIVVDSDNQWDIYVGNVYIKCFEWGSDMAQKNIPCPRRGTFASVMYQSRLYSGFIDRKELVDCGDGQEYDYGPLDCRRGHCVFMKKNFVEKDGFVIRGDEVVAYKRSGKIVTFPEGITSISSCLFWDNQEIEEVVLPDSLTRMGGDLFYNCKNLKKVRIPKAVVEMGDDPFAGCPNLELECRSPHFDWDGHLLYQGNRLIHCQIKGAPKRVVVREGTKTVGKHVFYLCDQIEEIVMPKSLKRMQNFPFSGCLVKSLIFQNSNYKNIDGVVYTGNMKEVVGCLNSTVLKTLEIPEGVEKIARNSFFRCLGIGEVVLPSTLHTIAYNPFNGCSNIGFVSRSESFKVIDGVLYNGDVSKLICYPKSKAVGVVSLPDSVVELERSAFSGCSNLEGIVLKNVAKIGKSCFSGCSSFKRVFVPDFVSYVGEWAFSHCPNLEEVSFGPNTYVDRNCFSESSCSGTRRECRGDYLVESENLYFLRGCRSALSGIIDSIIIDPPYNSKIDDVGYQDDFGGSYSAFLKERFLAAKPLLKPNGWMVVYIDRGGLKAVKEAAVEIFGKSNVRVRLWKKLDRRFDQNKEKKPGKKKVLFEYIVFCAASRDSKLSFVCTRKGKNKRVPFVFSGYGTTSSAKDEIAEVFGSRSAFSTPKPVALVREIVRATCPKDGIVMDFFAGSGTLGVAVMDLNHQDGGRRNYLLVTNSESNFAERIAEKRLIFAEEKYGGSHMFIK